MEDNDMNNKARDPRIEFLFKAVLSLQDTNECYEFFEDLCTVSEVQEMSRRMWAAKLLSDGLVYTEIAEKTGLSTATISRVNKCLKYGNEGYIKALERVALMEKAEKRG
jgi:TrpR-related protein YerC/YecD